MKGSLDAGLVWEDVAPGIDDYFCESKRVFYQSTLLVRCCTEGYFDTSYTTSRFSESCNIISGWLGLLSVNLSRGGKQRCGKLFCGRSGLATLLHLQNERNPLRYNPCTSGHPRQIKVPRKYLLCRVLTVFFYLIWDFGS